MSTSCNIGIYKEKPIYNYHLHNAEALLYLHNDGYPSGEYGVMQNILPFLQQFKNDCSINDSEYLAARLITHLCNNSDTYPMGYGVSKDVCKSIKYFYAIYPNAIDVYAIVDKKYEHIFTTKIE